MRHGDLLIARPPGEPDVLAELRASTTALPGTVVTFGQPISHRIDHMISGATANFAVRLFGPELFRLRMIAEDVTAELSTVRGIADLSVEQQADIPQVRISPRRAELSKYGMSVVEVAGAAEVALSGHVVTRRLQEGAAPYGRSRPRTRTQPLCARSRSRR